MTLKELSKHYLVNHSGVGKTYRDLYVIKPNSGLRMVHKYLATIHFTKGKCRVIKSSLDKSNETYIYRDNVSDLMSDVNRYVESLPYSSEYYNQSMRMMCHYAYIIHDYLCMTLKFNSKGYNSYVFENPDVYGRTDEIRLRLSNIDFLDEIVENHKVSIVLDCGEYSWINVEVDLDVEKIKSAIDSLLAPLHLSKSIGNYQALENLNNVDMNQNELYKKMLNLNSYDIESNPMKDALKDKLKQLLVELS